MPELPDITVYVEAMRARMLHRRPERVLIKSVFLVRTFELPVDIAEGRAVTGVERLGKRVVVGFEGDIYYAFHLMIAGRFAWKPPRTLPRGKHDLGAVQFELGTLLLTEASATRRAALHILRGREALAALAPRGVEPLACTPAEFRAALTRENRTLKRALTSPHLFSGIGNAYSDEILFEAGLSPVKLTRALNDDEVERLYRTTGAVLLRWTEHLRAEFGLDRPGGGRFPDPGEITAFRPEFFVHGRYRQPCLRCGHLIARIRRAENEINYCPTCQTGGRVLADRSLSRLMKEDWPRTVEEWEGLRPGP